MPFGDRFCRSRKGGIEEGGWVHLKGADSMVGTGRAISVLFGINGVRNKRSRLVGPPFPVFKACFSSMAGWHFSGDFTRCWLIGRCD